MTQDSKVNLVILGTNRAQGWGDRRKGDLKGMRQTSLPRSGVVYAQIKRAAGPKEKDREVRRQLQAGDEC